MHKTTNISIQSTEISLLNFCPHNLFTKDLSKNHSINLHVDWAQCVLHCLTAAVESIKLILHPECVYGKIINIVTMKIYSKGSLEVSVLTCAMKSCKICLLTDLEPLSHSCKSPITLEIAVCCFAEPIVSGKQVLALTV